MYNHADKMKKFLKWQLSTRTATYMSQTTMPITRTNEISHDDYSNRKEHMRNSHIINNAVIVLFLMLDGVVLLSLSSMLLLLSCCCYQIPHPKLPPL